MINRHIAGCALLIALCSLYGVSARQITLTEAQVIELLNSGNQINGERAVVYIRKYYPREQRSARIDAALLRELGRLNEVRRQRREEDRAGKPLVGDFPAEYYRDVIELVSEPTRPTAIPALTGALGTGRMVDDALAKFGAQALPPILEIARSRVGTVSEGNAGDTPPEIVSDALTTLSLIAPSAGLPEASRAAIAGVARERLSGHQHPSVVIAACKLAIATKDPGLRQRVAQLADDDAQVTALGISDVHRAQQVRLLARQALAGR
jgi:hypothetical protein